MNKKLLLRTNLLLCAILAVGFAAVSAVSYASNIGLFRRDVERVSALTSESIYHQINAYFARPVSVSMTMANDSLLKSLLREEDARLDDGAYLAELQNYLNVYKQQYGYNSVFLVSTHTNRYYRYSGLDRVLTRDEPENAWYYDFLASAETYTLDVDNDESQAAGRAVTAFVNCKIYDGDGGVMGVVGVGMQVGELQGLLQSHKQQYGTRAMLIDDTGTAAISSEYDGNDLTSGLFSNFEYISGESLASVVAQTDEAPRTFWVNGRQGDCFVASQYVPAIQWHLVVESDTAAIEAQFRRQLLLQLCVVALIVLVVLLVVNKLVWAYNGRLLKQVVSQELEYHTLIKQATKEMYADVYEFDLTHGKAVGEETRQFFESLGLAPGAGFQKAMRAVAQKQVKEEYREGFLAMASQKAALAAWREGTREMKLDLMMNTHWQDYRWVRLRARLFFWNADESVHMIIYSQDIHDEKERESRLVQENQTDALTGLYNRRYMEQRLDTLVNTLARTGGSLGVLMIDVDCFKKYNDTYGHTMGDACLAEVAEVLRSAAKRECDFIARYGGEEFVAVLPGADEDGARNVAEKLLQGLKERAIPHESSDAAPYVTVSIGGASGHPGYPLSAQDYLKRADEALYTAKHSGRNRYSGTAL